MAAAPGLCVTSALAFSHVLVLVVMVTCLEVSHAVEVLPACQEGGAHEGFCWGRQQQAPLHAVDVRLVSRNPVVQAPCTPQSSELKSGWHELPIVSCELTGQ